MGQSFEHPVAADAGVVADRQLGAISKIDPTLLATMTMEEKPKGRQQPRHQGHKPSVAGKLGKAVVQLLLHPITPEMFEVPVG